ncbi:hypothetical protein AH04_29 [Erwinia phage AH04]|uniref:Uncharacterized protein n=1 Tax=Erwinia phage AH04 TaxID=2869569 RepID=A0AAE8BQ92_9CAUD|nr:hypothetical protein PQC02_gp285 [Erwinia phage AH04]QZA70516.1 hypothetical protein AH04_29 [Erwinia phage AH04]
MNVKEELQRSVDVYATKLKKKIEKDIDTMLTSLNEQFVLPKPELQKYLLETFVNKFSADIDQCDTQALLHFVIKFSEVLNLLKAHKLKDFSPLAVNGYIFTPNGGIPASIDVEHVESKTPLGKIVIQLDMITVRTSVPEIQYHVDSSYVKDDVVMNVLGNFIVKFKNNISPLKG